MPALKALVVAGLVGVAACRPQGSGEARVLPCVDTVGTVHGVGSSWDPIAAGSIPAAWELPSGTWRPLEARRVAPLSGGPLAVEGHESGCLLELVVVRVWRGGCDSQESVADVQVIFSPDPVHGRESRAQTLLVHDVRGALERAEVVTAGGSALVPAPAPPNTVFHLVVPGEDVQSEVIGVRASPWQVTVYGSQWIDLAAKPRRDEVRRVGELSWPSMCRYRIESGTAADAVETAEETRQRLSPCGRP